jgi:hypothetical protein
MTVPVATIGLVNGAGLLAEAVYAYIWEFRQMALFSVLPVKNPLALRPLFQQ